MVETMEEYMYLSISLSLSPSISNVIQPNGTLLYYSLSLSQSIVILT